MSCLVFLGPIVMLEGTADSIISFNELREESIFNARVKLYQLKDWWNAKISIYLSAINMQTNVRDMKNWGSAVSVGITNSVSGFSGSKVREFNLKF